MSGKNSWPVVRVEEICERVSVGIVIQPSKYYTDGGQGVRAFRSANVGAGKIVDRDWVYLTAAGHAANRKSELAVGDVLIVRSGVPGTACVVDERYAGSNAIDLVIARPRPQSVLPEFLAEFTNSDPGKRQVVGGQGGLALKHFNVGEYKRMELPLPPIEQQRRIVDVLRTWDEAIDSANRLIDAKRKRLASLRHSLMIGFAKRNGYRWKRVELRDVTRELGERNANGRFGRDAVMGVTKAQGLVPMREQTMADDLARYQILPPRAFAYNPMRINVGSITMSRLDREVVVSPDYVLFECIENRLAPEYLDHLRQTHFWSHYINAAGAGSVRVRIYYDALAEILAPIPPIADQRRILTALDAASAELAVTERYRDTLQRQKRGLMQKLLTGEWRTTEQGGSR